MIEQPTGSTSASKPTSKFSLWANLPVTVPILFGVVGLIMAVMILTWKGCHSTGKYRDFILSNTSDLTDTILQTRIDQLSAKLKTVTPKKRVAPPISQAPTTSQGLAGTKKVAGSDSNFTPPIDTALIIENAIRASKTEQRNLYLDNADTSLQQLLTYISIDRHQIADALVNEKNSDCDIVKKKVPAVIKDTLPLFGDTSTLRLDLSFTSAPNKSLISFVTKYPTFGFWFILGIGQMVMWLILIALMIGNVKGINEIAPALQYNFKTGLVSALLPLLAVGIFAAILYYQLIDTYIVFDCQFQDGFTNRMLWYAIPGYATAILCFSVYLYTANKLQILNTASRAIKLSEDTELQKKYLKLKSSFEFAFLASAIILSVFVLWTAVLFNGLNSIDAFKFYEVVTGRVFFDYNLIYFLAFIHTIILLIFYIPVRIQFNNLEITTATQELEAQGKPPVQKSLQSIWEIIKTILITTSPLLTTVLEKLITVLFE